MLVDDPTFLTGQFLLALPGMGDPRFDRAVIAMCAHDGNGALGIGVGATIAGLGLHDLLEQFEIATDAVPNAPVHFGGPCEPRRGFVLHSREWSGQDTIDVAGRWALSATVDALRAIASGKGPKRWAVALGYAGWTTGQLEGELVGSGWFTIHCGAHLIFDVPAAERWTRAYASAGIDPRMLAAGTGTA